MNAGFFLPEEPAEASGRAFCFSAYAVKITDAPSITLRHSGQTAAINSIFNYDYGM